MNELKGEGENNDDKKKEQPSERPYRNDSAGCDGHRIVVELPAVEYQVLVRGGNVQYALNLQFDLEKRQRSCYTYRIRRAIAMRSLGLTEMGTR